MDVEQLWREIYRVVTIEGVNAVLSLPGFRTLKESVDEDYQRKMLGLGVKHPMAKGLPCDLCKPKASDWYPYCLSNKGKWPDTERLYPFIDAPKPMDLPENLSFSFNEFISNIPVSKATVLSLPLPNRTICRLGARTRSASKTGRMKNRV